MVNKILTRYRVQFTQSDQDSIQGPKNEPFIQSHVCKCDITKCLSVTGYGMSFLHDLYMGKISRQSHCCYNDISATSVSGGTAPLYFIGSNNGSIAMGDLRTTNKKGNCLFQMENCHNDGINTLYNMKSRDYVLISASKDGYLKLFDLRYPCKMQISSNNHQGLPFSTFRLTKSYSNMNFSVSPDERILSISIDEEALICTLDTQIGVIKSCNVESGIITKTQFSDNSATLFISLINDDKSSELVSWHLLAQNFVTWQTYSLSSSIDVFYDDVEDNSKTPLLHERNHFNDDKLTFALLGNQCIISTSNDKFHFLDTFDGQTSRHISTTLSPVQDYRQLHLESHPKKLLISSHYCTRPNKNYVKIVIHQIVDNMDSKITLNHCHPICASVST